MAPEVSTQALAPIACMPCSACWSALGLAYAVERSSRCTLAAVWKTVEYAMDKHLQALLSADIPGQACCHQTCCIGAMETRHGAEHCASLAVE